MTDQPKDNSLRGRIATVLWEALRTQNNVVNFDALADAVIRELNLERQDHYDPHCDYYRYVTDWIAPND